MTLVHRPEIKCMSTKSGLKTKLKCFALYALCSKAKHLKMSSDKSLDGIFLEIIQPLVGRMVLFGQRKQKIKFSKLLARFSQQSRRAFELEISLLTLNFATVKN